MNDKELDRLIEEAMKIEEKKLVDIVENEPSLAGVEAPDEIRDKLFARIQEYEEEKREQERLEMERLARRYKRVKRWNKVIVLIAAIVCLLALGVTSMGGPKRVLEEFKRTIAGREQTYTNTDDDKTIEIDEVGESEAIGEIEKTFGSFPVKLYYVPENIGFTEYRIEEESQNARMYYEGIEGENLCYIMWFNYRATSTMKDIEDPIKKQYDMTVDAVNVFVKQYDVEGSNIQRWRAEFQYQEVQYYIEMNGIEELEVKKIVENLKFF